MKTEAQSPAVYGAILRVAAQLARSGVSKTRTNEVDGYAYRSIDDVMASLSPLLARHRLCVLPRVTERTVSQQRNQAGELLLGVALKVAFTLSSARDGSSHIIEAYGEALDPGDKATAKAMSAAYKSAMIQVFCIPVTGTDDPDATSHRIKAFEHSSEPVEGWDQWAAGIIDTVRICESEGAIKLVQERNLELLRSLSRERPQLYRDVGAAFQVRSDQLKKRSAACVPPSDTASAPPSEPTSASGRRSKTKELQRA